MQAMKSIALAQPRHYWHRVLRDSAFENGRTRSLSALDANNVEVALQAIDFIACITHAHAHAAINIS